VAWAAIHTEAEILGVRIISVVLVDQVHLEVLVLLEHLRRFLRLPILSVLEEDSYLITKDCHAY
jgi:hypothetical protein